MKCMKAAAGGGPDHHRHKTDDGSKSTTALQVNRATAALGRVSIAGLQREERPADGVVNEFGNLDCYRSRREGISGVY